MSRNKYQQRNNYKFYKASCFMGQNLDYFTEKKLHTQTSIQTVGRVVYTPQNILLESLDHEGKIYLNVQTPRIPRDGSYVYLFGRFSYFQDVDMNTPYNFEKHCDDFVVALDMPIWNEIDELEARQLEKLLCNLSEYVQNK